MKMQPREIKLNLDFRIDVKTRISLRGAIKSLRSQAGQREAD